MLYAAVNRTSGEPLDVVAELDLSISQARLLIILSKMGGEAAVGELAERLPLSPAAASRAVEGLHQAGLVRRHEDSADRRIKQVAITDEGRHVTERFMQSRMNALREFAEQLTGEERAALSSAIGRILERTGGPCEPSA